MVAASSGPVLPQVSVPLSRCLVIRGGGLGDFILTLPLLSFLRSRWPNMDITSLAHLEYAELARSSGYTDLAASLDSSEIHLLFRDQTPDNLTESGIGRFLIQFDLAVSFLHDPSEVLLRNLQALVRHVVPIPRPKESGPHAARQFIAALGLPGDIPPLVIPQIRLSRITAHSATTFLNSFGLRGRPLVAVHPGSGSPSKNWPLEKFSSVLQRIPADLDAYTVVITGEADVEIRKRLQQLIEPDSCVFLDSASLTLVAAIIQRSQVFLGNDSGVGHLAAAVGTPVISLFGPTNPRVWRPLGRATQILPFETTVDEILQSIAALIFQPQLEEPPRGR